MTETAPKRYAPTLIIHFICVSLFFPAFLSQYENVYYQDYFLSSLIGIFITINILLYWKLNLKRHLLPFSLISIGLVLYNAVLFHMYRNNPDLLFWKGEHRNVTFAFLFFIALLIVQDAAKIVSDNAIKWTIRLTIISNLIGLITRMRGISQIQMMNFRYIEIPYDEKNSFWGYFGSDAGEYALILLLTMSFFIVYRRHFRSRTTYLLSQTLLLFCLILTNSITFLLAAAILLFCQFIHFLITKYQIPKKYTLISFPFTAILGGTVIYFLFQKVDTFHRIFLIWKGTWNMLLENPLGLGVSFTGPYYIDTIEEPLLHAYNAFLTHMLRQSLAGGIIFTGLFAVIMIFSLLRRPTYQSVGIWTALLIPLSMNYSLQSLHLPFVLFMLYCIFFRSSEETDADSTSDTAAKPRSGIPSRPEDDIVPIFEIIDLDEEKDPS